MTRRLTAIALTVSLLLPAGPVARVALAQVACDPFSTMPEYDADVSTATEVLGFDFGVEQLEIDRSDPANPRNDINTYLAAVDATSDRVVTAEAATSVDGQSIRYAIVGREDRVTPEALAIIRANLQVLKDPQAHRRGPGVGPRRHAGRPVVRRERPRWRGERGGRVAPRPVRTRRSHGLRRGRHP